MTQEAFAALGGIKRVSQHLYELSERFPDVRYLQAVSEHGVDLQYLLLGRRQTGKDAADEVSISGEVLDQIYRAVEEFARDDKGDPISMETKLRLFQFLRVALEGTSQVDASDLRARLARLVRAA
jgi:hypothetical protein